MPWSIIKAENAKGLPKTIQRVVGEIHNAITAQCRAAGNRMGTTLASAVLTNGGRDNTTVIAADAKELASKLFRGFRKHRKG